MLCCPVPLCLSYSMVSFSPPGGLNSEYSHPPSRPSHPEGHWPLPDVLPHRGPHPEGNTGAEQGGGPPGCLSLGRGRSEQPRPPARVLHLCWPLRPWWSCFCHPCFSDGVCTQGLGKLTQFARAELSWRCRLRHPAPVICGSLQRGQLQLLWRRVHATHACGLCRAFGFSSRYAAPRPEPAWRVASLVLKGNLDRWSVQK